MSPEHARDRLDAHLREILAWHFSPETGCPFWLDWAAAAGWDPREEVRSIEEISKFEHFQDDWLRDEANERFVPKAFDGRPSNVFETGGTTGLPKQRIGWDDYKHDYEQFSETLDDDDFPRGANWLMVGPTGPRRLRLSIEHLANFRGGSCYFVDLDPRWVKKLIARGEADQVERYQHHVVDQAVQILKHRNIRCLFTTPRILEAIGERLSIPGAGVSGVFCGGTTMTPHYDCLACRACESVCPSGVQVGSIVEDARGLITESKTERPIVRFLKRSALGGVMARPKRLAFAMGMLRLYEVIGLRRLTSMLLKMLNPTLADRHSLMPTIPSRSERKPLPPVIPAEGTRRKRVAFFTGCVAAHMFPEVNRATVRALQRNGFEIVIPQDQGCCGALHLHNGLPGEARKLAKANIEAFRAIGAEAIVVNAAGCGAALTEYGHLLEHDEEAALFAGRVVDISAFLVREGFQPPTGRVNARVAYDAPCHLHHAQGIHEEPKQLLGSIPGVTLVPFRDPERCCGSAGIYNLTRYGESMQVLDQKMQHIREAKPDVVATGNPGCLIQLAHGVKRAGIGAEVTHPVVLLERAYRLKE